MGSPGADVLLDRRTERAVLRAALQDARAGRGRTVTLSGEAGIGKTRLLDYVAEEARGAEMLVVWGRAWEAGGAPGFLPWSQAIRALLEAPGGDALLDDLPAGAASWLATLAPDHVAVAPPSDIARAGEQARFALFDAVRSLLRASARSGPLVVLLEDLHAADVGSLRLLEMLAASGGDSALLIVATFRGLEVRARPDAAVALQRVGTLGDAVELGGLPEEDLKLLVDDRAGQAVAADVAATLHRFTEGNPLYAEEIVRVLAAEGGIERVGAGEVPLPVGVGETIRRRLRPLTASSAQTLSTAAVIGREFRLRTLESVLGGDRGALLAQLQDSIAAGVVVADREEIGRYRFAHALFREALYDDLDDVERARVHGEVGAALELLYGDAIERRLAELAHHYLAAAPLAGMDKAIDYATRAGRRALEQTAYEEAADHFQRALGALGLVSTDESRRADLLLSLAHARVRAGDTPGARAALLECADVARHSGDPIALGQAALGLAVWGMTPTTDEEGIALLEEALDRLGDRDPGLRARLLSRLSSALSWTPDHERRLSTAEEALAISAALGDESTRGFVLIHASIGLVRPDTLDRRVTNIVELQGLAQRTGELEWTTYALLHRIPAGLEVGDGPGVVADIDALERLIGRMQQPRVLWLVPSHRALLAAIEGNWDTYEERAAEALQVGTSVPGTVAAIVHAAQQLCVRWSQGRIGELDAALEAAATMFPGVPAWRCAQALGYADTGREARASAALGLLAADGFAGIPHDHTRLICLGFLAETCVLLGDRERGALLEQMLLPFAGRHLCTAQGTYAGPLTRHLGQLAALRGDLDAALDHFGVARVEAERMNAAPYLARIALDEGLALAGAGDPRAAERLRRAERLATELSMPHVADRARDAGVAAPPPPPAEDGVAELRREGDVWSLSFNGRTIRVKHTRGLNHLALLLDAPGLEVHAIDLVNGGVAGGKGPAFDDGLNIGGSGGTGPALDGEAKRQYRVRIDELREEIDEADEYHDVERAARAREELDFLAQELAGAVGLGGRDRETGSNAERARVNATRAIRTIIKRISELDPALGHELDTTVRTGTYCSYVPDPRRPVTWRVARG